VPKVSAAVPSVSLLMPDLMLSKLVENTTYPSFELIVVDDGSTDSSRQILRRWRDSGSIRSFTLIEAEHRGVQESLNTAARASSGELLVQMDGDATVETPGWLDRMVAFHQSDARVAVVTAAVILDSGRVHAYGVNVIAPEGLHDRGTEVLEPVGARTLHSAVRRPRAAALPPPPGAVEVDASIGCCMLFPRALWDEVSGFDIGFSPVWFEDVDMSLSARRLGGKVFVLGDVRILHRGNLAEENPSLARRAARLLPQRVKDLVVAAGRMEQPTPEVFERLRGHYAHWQAKWGFDPLNPDMDEVLARYGGTEVCWRYEPELVRAGERIAAAYLAAEPVSA
jgi:GT2 family glycosyltransferase